MTYKKGFITFLLCLFISPLFATIKIGTEFFYPPYVISTSLGFDINLMQTICQRMQQKCIFIPMRYHEMFPALDTGQIDIAISRIETSASLQRKYLFSEPYLISKGQFLVLQPSVVKSATDLYGSTIGITKHDGFHQFLRQKYKKDFNIVEYRNVNDLVNALSRGRIAAAFMHRLTAVYWLQNGGKKFKALGNSANIGQGLVIIALHSGTKLIENINQQLDGMEDDNTYLNLYNSYVGLE